MINNYYKGFSVSVFRQVYPKFSVSSRGFNHNCDYIVCDILVRKIDPRMSKLTEAFHLSLNYLFKKEQCFIHYQ